MGTKYNLPEISTNTALTFTATKKVDGVPVNLSGWGARFVLARNATATPVLDHSSSPQIVVDGAAGKVTVYISDSGMAAVTPGKYLYQLYLIDTQTSKRDFLYGEIKIRDGLL